MDTVEKRRKSAEKYAVTQRNYRRARERALTRLSQMYNEDYKELLAEEKKRDKETQVAWTSLSGNFYGGSNSIPLSQTTDRDDTLNHRTQSVNGAEV